MISEWNLWQSIATALRLQRILCVSPFYLDHPKGKLKSSCATKLYSIFITVALLVVFNIAIFHLNFIETFIEFVPSGIVWQILSYYAFYSMNIYFIFNMFFIWIGYPQQIQFLERIHQIDQTIKKDFSSSVDHKSFKRNLMYGIVIVYIYYGLQFIGETAFVFNTKNYILIPPTLAYCIKNLILNSQAYTFTYYLFLIQRRYRLIFTIYQNHHRNYIHYLKSGIIDDHMENLYVIKLRQIFELFREITNLIPLYDDTFGWIFVSQIIKVFMMTLTQLYFVFLTATDATLGENGYKFCLGFFYLFLGDTIKMFMFIIAIHMVYAAVNNLFFEISRFFFEIQFR